MNGKSRAMEAPIIPVFLLPTKTPIRPLRGEIVYAESRKRQTWTIRYVEPLGTSCH